MALESVLISLFLERYTPVLALLAGLAVGDLLLFLGFLAGAGKTNFWYILLFGFIGGLIHDIAFYYIANSKAIYFLKKRFKLSARRNKIAQLIEKMSSGHYFIPVVMAKFIYGVRDAVIIYVAHNTKKLKKYLLVVSSADAIWLVTITSIGWLAGKGFTSVIVLFKGVEKWLFFLVIGLIVMYLINKFLISIIFKRVRKEAKKILKNF